MQEFFVFHHEPLEKRAGFIACLNVYRLLYLKLIETCPFLFNEQEDLTLLDIESEPLLENMIFCEQKLTYILTYPLFKNLQDILTTLIKERCQFTVQDSSLSEETFLKQIQTCNTKLIGQLAFLSDILNKLKKDAPSNLPDEFAAINTLEYQLKYQQNISPILVHWPRFLSQLIDKTSLLKKLETLPTILAIQLDQTQAWKASLESLLGKRPLQRLIRLQAIIETYTRWYHYLKSRKANQYPNDLLHKRKITILLSYDKKTYLQEQLETLSCGSLYYRLSLLAAQVEHTDSISLYKKLCAILFQEKDFLVKEINPQETTLQNSCTLLQWIGIKTEQIITQHPTYKLGCKLYQKNYELADKASLNHKDSPKEKQMNEQIKSLAGLITLGISLWGANRFSYSYHLLSSFNHLILSEITNLFQLAQTIDRLNRRTWAPLFDTLENHLPDNKLKKLLFDSFNEAIQWDEEGLLLKYDWLNASLSLGILVLVACGFAGQSLLPTVLGYIGGIGLGSGLSYLGDKISNYFNFSANSHSRSLIQAFHHMAGYYWGNKLGRYAGQFWQSSREENAQYLAALKTLGLKDHPDLTDETLHQTYRNLAKQYHPDHCSSCNPQTMTELNEAMAFLKQHRFSS